ncbi:MAG: hypothetical protein AAF639_33285, partial [Chloroflexota bacterium]
RQRPFPCPFHASLVRMTVNFGVSLLASRTQWWLHGVAHSCRLRTLGNVVASSLSLSSISIAKTTNGHEDVDIPPRGFHQD